MVRSLCLIALLLFASSGCSIPNMESQNCGSARDVVKRLYSVHFGSEMSTSPEAVRERESFLTDQLANLLKNGQGGANDYFTRTDSPPKAFRVGSCIEKNASSIEMQVILLWRNDDVSRQEEVRVEVVKAGEKWLVDKVF